MKVFGHNKFKFLLISLVSGLLFFILGKILNKNLPTKIKSTALIEVADVKPLSFEVGKMIDLQSIAGSSVGRLNNNLISFDTLNYLSFQYQKPFLKKIFSDKPLITKLKLSESGNHLKINIEAKSIAEISDYYDLILADLKNQFDSNINDSRTVRMNQIKLINNRLNEITEEEESIKKLIRKVGQSVVFARQLSELLANQANLRLMKISIEKGLTKSNLHSFRYISKKINKDKKTPPKSLVLIVFTVFGLLLPILLVEFISINRSINTTN